MKIDKDELLIFLQKTNSNIKEVLDFKLKDWDDEDGAMGEHFIVTVNEDYLDPEVLGFKNRFVEYQVSKSAIKIFFTQHNAIKLLRVIDPPLNSIPNTFTRSLVQYPIIAPGKYEGLFSGHYVQIRFKNGKLSKKIKMNSGVKGIDCEVKLQVTKDGWVEVL